MYYRHAFWMLTALLCPSLPAVAQTTQGPAAVPAMESQVLATPLAERQAGVDRRQQLQAASLVAEVPFRSVGPVVMSGRVVDVEVDPADPTHFYVAYASGGLWETRNNGLSFEPLFDREAVMTLGDIAVDWTTGTIWVGTGENNSSRSSYAGMGLFRSTDGGKTWQHRGLADTQRTGRLLVHPNDPNTLWVAAAGPLYHASPERGLFKTTDGGQTWRKTLFIDDNTGAIDLVMDPANPAVLYAATWHRERRAWNFVEGGRGSGIHKSTDGGETWTLLTTAQSGFPTGDGVGRIGLALYARNPDILYAVVDNQNHQAKKADEETEQPVVSKEVLRTITPVAFLALKDEDIEQFLRDNDFPEKYTGASVRKRVQEGQLQPVALVEYLEDANTQLFDTPIIGQEVYRSDDGGRSWKRTHEGYLEGVCYTYCYYFGQVRIAPETPDRLYLLGVPLLKSEDGGKTFQSMDADNLHGDHHALWLNPDRPGHLINGNDGGINLTYDDGKTWFKANSPAVGQFYAVQVDEATPYNVYGGLQDNGVWAGPSTYEANPGWQAVGDYPYDFLYGGDGMQVQVDTRTNDVVYTGLQFGYYSRLDRQQGRQTSVRPQHELGERPLRFNWQTPILLSRHQQDIFYIGANRLYRSFNRGEDLHPVSPDLTKGGRAGDVPYGTLTTLSESPLRFGLLYTGSDDGYLHVTRDAGASWQRISDSLPQDLWVSRVAASHHIEGRVYTTLNGYRYDHFDAYLYRSDDYGQTWTRLGTDLPAEPLNVVLEDPTTPLVLYVGSDHGLYVSLDGGASFMALFRNLPNVPVHDLALQAREKELVVGTHGRSLYIASVREVQQLPGLLDKPLHLFPPERITHSPRWGRKGTSWAQPLVPKATLAWFAGMAGTATLRIKTEDGFLLSELTHETRRGVNYLDWDLSIQQVQALNQRLERAAKKGEKPAVRRPADDGKVYLAPGRYAVELLLHGQTVTGTLEVKARS
jgi:photosystem II stability/assembly factor-like uncharacterized protein